MSDPGGSFRAGVDIRHIAEFLGHASVGTTEVYTRVAPEDLRRAMEGVQGP